MQSSSELERARWPDASSYRSAARNVQNEYSDILLEPLYGSLPTLLRGVLYRNGPGRNENFGVPYGHPFDGDGLVLRFEFGETGIRYRNRFVRTREYEAEARAGRPLYRSFGTNLPGGLRKNLARLRFKNAANTSVIRYRDSLLALWEGGLPHALDPRTLSTKAREDFDGTLQNHRSSIDRWLNPELPFSAHPKTCPVTGDIFNFGMALGAKPRLYLYRLGPDGEIEKHSLALPELSFVHDFVLTENHLLFILPRVSFDVPRTLAGLSTPVDSIKTQDRPGNLWVIDRQTFKVVSTASVPSGFIFHFSNGYEEGNEIMLEGCHMPRFPSAKETRQLLEGQSTEFPKAQLTRYRLASGKISREPLEPLPAELPEVDARFLTKKHRVTFYASSPLANPTPFLTRIVRRELTGKRVEQDFAPNMVGEPVFVPHSADATEGSGHLLVMTHCASEERAELHILDAETLEKKAGFALPHTVPPGFHGFFEPNSVP